MKQISSNRSRPVVLLTFGLLLAAPLLALPAAYAPRNSEKDTPPRPNIVVILTDDMGFSDLGCFGGEIDTPHLDRLAAGGLRFTNVYNCARCWPTRASLMTGLYPEQTAPIIPLNQNTTTVPEVLRTAGYQTGMVGKWHLSKTAREGGPVQRGFDFFYGTIIGAGSFWRPPTLTRDEETLPPPETGYYYTDVIGDEAVRQIDSFAESDRPFFQYVAFTAPHWPLHAPEKTVEKYLPRYTRGWAPVRAARYRRMVEMGIVEPRHWTLPAPEPQVAAWETLEHRAWRARNMAVYAAMIDHVDQAVGRIVGRLRRIGKLDDTLILVLNDNGACAEHLSGDGWSTARNVLAWAKSIGKEVSVGDQFDTPSGGALTFHSVGHNWANAQNTPLRRYKANVHEGGSCTPAIAHWPRRIAARGSISREVGHVIDLMPTCVELAGAKYPAERNGNALPPMEGESLVPALTGNTVGERTLYFNHGNSRAVRRGPYKAIQEGKHPWALYHLDRDKSETRDLARLDPARLTQMVELWTNWIERVRK